MDEVPRIPTGNDIASPVRNDDSGTAPRPIEWRDLDPELQKRAVHKVMRRLRMRQSDAEEFVADAALRLIEKRPLVRHPYALLLTTTMRLISTARREKQRRPRLVTLDFERDDDDPHNSKGEPVAATPTPLDTVADDEEHLRRRVRLQEALAKLSEEERELVDGYYYQERTLGDLARERESNTRISKNGLFQVRERLRRTLKTSNGSEL